MNLCFNNYCHYKYICRGDEARSGGGSYYTRDSSDDGGRGCRVCGDPTRFTRTEDRVCPTSQRGLQATFLQELVSSN